MLWCGAPRYARMTLVTAAFFALTYAGATWSGVVGLDEEETWTRMIMLDYGIDVTVLGGDLPDPDRAVWVGLASAVPGRDSGFKGEVDKKTPGALIFDLFWGETCIEGHACDTERKFKVVVHHEGLVFCKDEFSTTEISARKVVYELTESVDGCSLSRLP